MANHILYDSKEPKATITDSDGKEEQNPLLPIWLQEDRLVKSLIIATLSPEVRALTIGLTSVREVWKTLEECFANSSKQRARDLLRKLQEVHRDDHPTLHAYLEEVTMISNELAAINQPIDDGDKEELVQSNLWLNLSDLEDQNSSNDAQPATLTHEDCQELLSVPEPSVHVEEQTLSQASIPMETANLPDTSTNVQEHTQQQRLLHLILGVTYA
ncbi:hypothetical protein CCACVL1_21072 [Corchorus capsularis]|uniref:Uncharacterized protein n=1 Tax=Corchorus capsularis TaxID=210143 RepID=A0A1R3H893_COCAP|nr:hypothetical protein CCACVL1_21072 [Corchorus capsularis]